MQYPNRGYLPSGGPPPLGTGMNGGGPSYQHPPPMHPRPHGPQAPQPQNTGTMGSAGGPPRPGPGGMHPPQRMVSDHAAANAGSSGPMQPRPPAHSPGMMYREAPKRTHEPTSNDPNKRPRSAGPSQQQPSPSPRPMTAGIPSSYPNSIKPQPSGPAPAPEVSLVPLTEVELERVRMIIADAMQNIRNQCRAAAVEPQPEVHGFLLSRVKELYMQRYKTDLDHKRFGVPKMRDIIPLTAEDICSMVLTSQQSQVLLPLPDIDYSDAQAVAGGPGLAAGMRNIQMQWASRNLQASPHEPAAQPSMLPPGFVSAPPGLQGAESTGRLGGRPLANDSPEEKVRKLMVKFCKRILLCQRFFMFQEATRQLYSRESTPLAFGMRVSNRNRNPPLEPNAGGPSKPGGPASNGSMAAVRQGSQGDGAMGDGAATSEAENRARLGVDKGDAELYSTAAKLQQQYTRKLGELRELWIEGLVSYTYEPVGVLSCNTQLLRYLVEVSAAVKDTAADNIAPFSVIAPNGAQLSLPPEHEAAAVASSTGGSSAAGSSGVVSMAAPQAGGSAGLALVKQEPGGPMDVKQEQISEQERETAILDRLRLQIGAVSEPQFEVLAGECELVPTLGFLWDVQKVHEMWVLLHRVLLDHAYAVAGEKSALDSRLTIQPYPIVRLRDDYRRHHGAALHIAPLGFANLVDYVQWAAFQDTIIADQTDVKGEKGVVYPVFNPLRDLRYLLETRMRELCLKEAAQIKESGLPPGFTPQLRPEDGYRMDAVKLDFRNYFMYDLDNARLGHNSFKQLIELIDDLVVIHQIGSTHLLLPASLLRLRLLVVDKLGHGRGCMSVSEVQDAYMEMWGRPFTPQGSGYPSLTAALQALGDVCQTNGQEVTPQKPGTEAAGLIKLRRAVAAATHGHVPMITQLQPVPSQPPPPPRAGAGIISAIKERASAMMGTGPVPAAPIPMAREPMARESSRKPVPMTRETASSAAANTQPAVNRLPPHPGAARKASDPLQPEPDMTGAGPMNVAGSAAVPVDPKLMQWAAEAGLDPVILSMMVESARGALDLVSEAAKAGQLGGVADPTQALAMMGAPAVPGPAGPAYHTNTMLPGHMSAPMGAAADYSGMSGMAAGAAGMPAMPSIVPGNTPHAGVGAATGQLGPSPVRSGSMQPQSSVAIPGLQSYSKQQPGASAQGGHTYPQAGHAPYSTTTTTTPAASAGPAQPRPAQVGATGAPSGAAQAARSTPPTQPSTQSSQQAGRPPTTATPTGQARPPAGPPMQQQTAQGRMGPSATAGTTTAGTTTGTASQQPATTGQAGQAPRTYAGAQQQQQQAAKPNGQQAPYQTVARPQGQGMGAATSSGPSAQAQPGARPQQQGPYGTQQQQGQHGTQQQQGQYGVQQQQGQYGAQQQQGQYGAQQGQYGGQGQYSTPQQQGQFGTQQQQGQYGSQQQGYGQQQGQNQYGGQQQYRQQSYGSQQQAAAPTAAASRPVANASSAQTGVTPDKAAEAAAMAAYYAQLAAHAAATAAAGGIHVPGVPSTAPAVQGAGATYGAAQQQPAASATPSATGAYQGYGAQSGGYSAYGQQGQYTQPAAPATTQTASATGTAGYGNTQGYGSYSSQQYSTTQQPTAATGAAGMQQPAGGAHTQQHTGAYPTASNASGQYQSTAAQPGQAQTQSYAAQGYGTHSSTAPAAAGSHQGATTSGYASYPGYSAASTGAAGASQTAGSSQYGSYAGYGSAGYPAAGTTAGTSYPAGYGAAQQWSSAAAGATSATGATTSTAAGAAASTTQAWTGTAGQWSAQQQQHSASTDATAAAATGQASTAAYPDYSAQWAAYYAALGQQSGQTGADQSAAYAQYVAQNQAQQAAAMQGAAPAASYQY